MADQNIFSNSHLLPSGSLFGTDGIRGEAGTFLTAPLAMEVGYWTGKFWSGQGTVILGQDSRNSGDMLANAIAAGLNAAGLNVWRLGLCPTPCVSYLARNTEAIGGIMISASHNPPGDNGIKLFGSDGTKLLKDKTQKIEAALRGNPDFALEERPWGKHHHRLDLVLSYEKFLQSSLPTTTDFTGLKIVLDLAWGAATQVAPELFKALGAELIVLNELPDGDRINVNCGSTHLDQLKQAVLKEQADVGFAFDGDADRVLAVDEQGRMVDGDHLLYLWGKQLMDQQKLPDNLIVGTVMANLGFERAWEKIGGQFMRTPVGDQHVQASMWSTGAALGGEQSGHVLCHHLSVSGDGIQTALQFTQLLKRSGQSLCSLVDQAFSTYPQVLANVKVEDRDLRLDWEKSTPLKAAIEQATDAMGDRGRVLVRASGTEPVIRVMVEAEEQSLVDHWTNYLIDAVESYRDDSL